MTATVPPGTNQLQLCQQQVQQWQASLTEYRNSNAAAALPLPQDPRWQAMLGGGALYAYATAAVNRAGTLTAAPQASGFAVQQPATGLPATGLPPPTVAATAGGSMQRARAVTFSLPEQSKTPGESTADGTSPAGSTQVPQGSAAPGAATPGSTAGTQQASLLSDTAAYGALPDTADVQEDAGRASNKRTNTSRASTGQAKRSAQSKADDAKLRRKQANRESARRSRQRKEEEEKEFKQRLATSEAAADNLRVENGVLKQQLQQMTAIIDQLKQHRAALATQVRNLGGEVRAELVAPIFIPQVSDRSSILQQQQQQPQLHAPQHQSRIAGLTAAGVVAGSAGTFGLHQMQPMTGAAAVPWPPAGALSSGHT